MKLKILHFFLLFAATTAKDVYVEGATTDSPGAEAVVPAAKLGVNETLAASHRRMNRLGFGGVACGVPCIPGLKKCAVAPSGTEPCWELADPSMTDIPVSFLEANPDLTGTLKLGAAVKTIGSYAFYETKLTGLDLSDAASLASIGGSAFRDTDITGTLVIPANVETIGYKAFYETKVTGLDLSDAAKLWWIDAKAFRNTRITGTIETTFSAPRYKGSSFPKGVSIVSTIVPPGLKECAVAPSGTEPCWELADPDMTDIPDNFLRANTDLTGTLKLGAAVKTIGKKAFYKTKLTGLDLSNAASLVSIGDYAFIATDITGTLVIPANVETIGYAAFRETNLEGLDLSNAASLVSIGYSAFGHTDITGTLVIPAKVKTIGYGTFYSTDITGLDLSQAASLESIGVYAFANTDITGTLVIPANVETIGDGAFYYTKLLAGLDLSKAASLESIGIEAFRGTDITGTLVIPAKVETIGEAAFYKTELTGLDLSNAASLVSIGDLAFGGTDITGTLVIPAKVKMGGTAFPPGVTIVEG